jgi:hypothetical protein
MPVILSTQEDYCLKLAQANNTRDSISEKLFTKIGLVEWLKVKTLISSPSTANK